MSEKKVSLIGKAGGIVKAFALLANIPDPAAKYYVNEPNQHGDNNGMGFYADKFHVGIHNPHTHINLEKLKAEFQAVLDGAPAGTTHIADYGDDGGCEYLIRHSDNDWIVFYKDKWKQLFQIVIDHLGDCSITLEDLRGQLEGMANEAV